MTSTADARDPWENLRAEGFPASNTQDTRVTAPSKASSLETGEASYVLGQQDLEDNLGVLLDHSYGAATATKPRTRDRFIPGLDGFAGDSKWQPFVEFTIGPGGQRTHGQANLFAPLAQDADSLLFADLRTSAWTDDVQEGNFGAGYRQIVPGAFFGTDAIFGVYGFFDVRRSANENMFYQGTFGAELITGHFEFRANGYLPSGKQYVVGTAGSGVALNGVNIYSTSTDLIERALPGFDVEAGIKVDFSEAAIRFNAGYFRFERGDTLVEGPRFRAEVEIEDPFGFEGARLSVGGEVRNDKIRGTEAAGIIRLRMPLGGPSQANRAERRLSGVERLMTRRVYRDEDIVTPVVRSPTPTLVAPVTDVTTGEDLQAFFVANTARGVGDCSSVANACDFVTAQGLAGAGDTFLPVDAAGAISSVFTLNNHRQRVVGAGDNGTATVRLTDAAGSILVVTQLGGRPVVTGVNIGHFADTRIGGLSTSSATGIAGNGFAGSTMIDDVRSSGGGLNFSNSAATITVTDTTLDSGANTGIALTNLSGTSSFNNVDVTSAGGTGLSIDGGTGSVTFDSRSSLTQTGAAAAVSVAGKAGGSVTFGGRVTANTSTTTAIDLVGNPGATVSFTGGLDIDTSSGTGFSATGGGTVSVAASAGDESITATAGQALNLDGVAIGAGGFTLDSISSTGSATTGINLNDVSGTLTVSGPVTVSGSAGAGISLTGNTAALNFNGMTAITMSSASTGIDFAGTTGGAVSFADLDISLQAANAKGIDLAGAVINADVTATDFDLTSTSAAGTTAVDLSGTTGSGAIRLGDTDAGGASASIAGVNTGVRFTAASNATFTFGDGEAATDTGSSISATTAIAGGSTVSLGSYDFDDVNFTGTLDFTSAAASNLVFVAATATGDSSGSDVNNRASVATADAITTTGTTFVLINDGAAIDDVDGFTLHTGQTLASFGNGRTFAASGLVIPTNFSGIPGGGTSISDPTGNGAATLTRTGGAGDTLTVAGTVNLQDFILSNTAAGNGLTASGATSISSTGLTVQNVAGQGIDLNSLTGAASTFDNTVVSATSGNAIDIVNSTVSFTGGLAITTTSGTGFSATGGGTIEVAATAGAETISTATGQILNFSGVNVGASGVSFDSLSSSGTVAADAVYLNNVDGSGNSFSGGAVTVAGTSGAGSSGIEISGGSEATFTFANLSISNTGGSGVAISDLSGSFSVTGPSTISTPAANGIDVSGTNGAISFGDVDITGLGANAGLDLNGATLGGTVSFNSLDVTGTSAAGSIGIDLRGVSGGQMINIGAQASPVTGPSSSIAAVETGVFLDAASNAAFVFGDGELGVDRGSSIAATVQINATAAPVAGTFDFEDVPFTGSPGLGFGNGAIYYVDSDGAVGGGDGSGSSALNPMTLAAAELAAGAGDIVILINNANPISVAGSNGNDTLNLADSQQILGFGDGVGGSQGITVNYTVPPTILLSAAAITLTDPTGNGAATLATSAGNDVITLGASGNRIAGLDLNGNGAAARGINDTGAGAANTTIERSTVRNFTTRGIEITPSTNTTIDDVDFSGNAADVLLNAAGSTISNVTSLNATGTAFQIVNATGTTTLSNILVTNAGGSAFDFDSASGTVSATNVDINGTGAAAIDISGGSGVFTFDATSSLTQASNAAAVSVSGGHTGSLTYSGTINATNGTGLQFDNADGSQYNFNGTVTLNGGDAGIDIVNGSSASFTFSNTSITSPTGTAFNIDSSTVAALTFGGAITQNNSASAFVATGGTGGIHNISADIGASTGSAAAVNITSTGTYNFSGDLGLATTSGTGFSASGGGTIAVTGANTSINTTTGQILNWDGVNVGASGVAFDTLAASGTVANHGILINNVDGAGTFSGGNVTVAGTSGGSNTGITISGGSAATFSFASATIDNTAGDGILLSGANSAITFTTVDIDGTGGNGIQTVTNNNAVNINGGSIGATDDPTARGVIVNGGSGDVSVAASITKTTNGNIVEVTSRSGGTVTFSGNLSATGGGGNGIRVTNNTGGTTAFSGASKTLNTVVNNPVTLTNNGGHTVNFSNGGLDIDTTSGLGFSASGGGTISVTGVGNTINTTTGTALNLNGVTIAGGGVSFDSVGTTGATTDAVNITGTSGGTVTLSSVAITATGAANGIEINNAVNNVAISGGTVAGRGVLIFGNSGTVTIGANASASAGYAFAVGNRTGGTVTMNGTVTGSSGAVNLASNTGGTVTFNNTVTGTGAPAAGGVFVVSNTGGTFNFAALVDLDTTTADGIVVNGNNGAAITFVNVDIDTTSGNGISANGANSNVDISGTVDVATSGSRAFEFGAAGSSGNYDFSGVTSTQSGISALAFGATHAGTYSLGTQTVTSPGVNALTIANTTINLTYASLTVTGTNPTGPAILIDDSGGSLTINGGMIRSDNRGIDLQNDGGLLNSFSLTTAGAEFDVGNDAVFAETTTAGSTLNVNISGVTAASNIGAQAVEIAWDNGGGTAVISNNIFDSGDSTAGIIELDLGGTGIASATISNNTIAGNPSGEAIDVRSFDATSLRVGIYNNTISSANVDAIRLEVEGTSNLQATVSNNQVIAVTNGSGIFTQVSDVGATVCLNASGNSDGGAGPPAAGIGGNSFELDNLAGGTFQIRQTNTAALAVANSGVLADVTSTGPITGNIVCAVP